MQAGFTLRPVARLKIDEVYYLTRMRTAQASVFTNHLTRSRVNYQFTRALSLRMIVDYNAVLENAALIDLQRQKRLTGDALLTYLIHPGTALYLGYTDRVENLGLYDGVVRPIGFPSTTTARQFFAKVSYLFRFWKQTGRGGLSYVWNFSSVRGLYAQWNSSSYPSERARPSRSGNSVA